MLQADVSALDWPRWVHRGDRIACSHMSAEPVALLRSLAASAGRDADLSLFLGVPFTTAAAGFAPGARLTTFGGMGSAGQLTRTHEVRISMRHYSRCAEAFRDGTEPVDVALVSLARAPDGRLFLGASHGYALAAAHRARHVVAEINAQAPVVLGAMWPETLRIDASVEVDYPLARSAPSEPDDVERRIAQRVAPLVTDGACLQVGIGSLPSAVLDGLKRHRALGLHSGMLTPAIWHLIACGVLDNSRKPVDAGLSVTGCVFGDEDLYRAVASHPQVRLHEPGATHDPRCIAQLANFVAINSALEVDLMGQMNAETVPGPHGRRRQVGGVGGLNDFVRASRHSPGGLAITAIPSRHASGAPRIVATLGGPATVAASDADVIVTEYGVAHLREATLDERALRLIAIAHPDDRDALSLAARRSGQLP